MFYLTEDAGAPKVELANMIDLKINWDDYFKGKDLKTLQINMLVSASHILNNHYNKGYVFSWNGCDAISWNVSDKQ